MANLAGDAGAVECEDCGAIGFPLQKDYGLARVLRAYPYKARIVAVGRSFSAFGIPESIFELLILAGEDVSGIRYESLIFSVVEGVEVAGRNCFHDLPFFVQNDDGCAADLRRELAVRVGQKLFAPVRAALGFPAGAGFWPPWPRSIQINRSVWRNATVIYVETRKGCWHSPSPL